MSPLTTPSPSFAKSERSSRRRVVRVGQLPLAAALALGAPMPWALAQTASTTVITPLTGNAATQTVLGNPQTGVTTVTTATLRDGNAFNNFSLFQVGAGDTVKMVVPTGANWLVNVVRDGRVQVDGLLQSRVGATGGAVGGNMLFIDRHGFAVGPNGRVDTGRLSFAAPSTTFVDAMLASGPGLSANQVTGILSGQFDRSDTGAVQIDGEIHATEGVQIMAGKGAGSAQAVSVAGRIVVNGRAAGMAVNLGDLRSLAPVLDRDGVIDITTPGDILLNGKLLSDGSHWTQAGAVRVVAAGDIQLGALSLLSASAGDGSGGQGGKVTLFAHGSASNAAGATLAARGDGLGAGGFIELSAAKRVTLGDITLDAGSEQGQAGLAYIDPTDLVISSNVYSNGGHLVYEADKTLTVNTGVRINTRHVAAGANADDPLEVSVNYSGDITLKAPSITVGAGAVLDASVRNVGGSTWEAGDIVLSATQTSVWETMISLSDANASIDVAGTLTGRNVTLTASIESAASFGGTSGAIQQKGVELLLGELPFAASLSYVEAKGNATVTVRPTAVLAATRNLSLTALADRSVSVETEASGSAKANLSAGFARVLGTTKVDVQAGASLTADVDIALVAASKTTVSMSSSAAGETDPDTGTANVASIVFAGSTSDVTTAVNVAAGAELQSDRDTLLQAFHSGQYDTSAEVTIYGAGTAGVVGALSLQNSSTSVTMNGELNAGGQVRLMAMNASVKNAITATATNASEEEEASFKDDLPESLTYSKDDAGAAAEAQLLESFQAMAENIAASSDEASGETPSSGGAPAEPKPPALRLAGALTWSESNHSTRATLGAGAKITAGGNAVVDAQTLVGNLQSVALAEASADTEDAAGTKTSLAVAFNYANHSVTTRAQVGAGATVNAGHVAVNAATDIPQFYTALLPVDPLNPTAPPPDWSTFSTAYDTFMAGTDLLYEGFNSRVGATSAAPSLAAAGAVNLTFMRNDTRAWVDTGAKITTTVNDGAAWSYGVREVGFASDLVEMLIPINTYDLDKDLGVLGDFVSTTRSAPIGQVDEINFTRSFDAATVVRAENHVQTLHHAGGTGPEAGGDGAAAGGTFSMVDRSNTAIAGIADRVEINTQRLDVTAKTSDWLVSISPTSGQGAGIAANGIASYNKLSETTHASVSREALVTAPTVNVDARLSLGVIAITGAVSRSENSGVGIGLAINDIKGDTQAYVGDNDTEGGGTETAEGNAGFIATGALRVQAKTDGMIVAVGVAGATAGEEPPPEEPAATDPAAATPTTPTTPTEPASTGDNLAAKTGTDSADAQAQLDGNDSTMAPLEEASAPVKGSGSDQAAASDPAASKPPSFSIAGAGAIVTNYSDLDTTALLDGAVVHAIGSGTSTVAVRALSDLTQVSVAGGGALSLSKNASTTFTAAIAGAVAIQDSDDDTSARIVGSTISDLADQADSLVVQALKSGERTAVATGISANLSKGSTTSVSVVGAASVTTTSDDTLAEMVNSDASGDLASPAALGVQVVAYDRSRIGAGGGALSVSTGKGSAGVGAAISIVNAKGSARALVSDGSIMRAHDLAVLALSSQKVVGVGAVAGLQTSSDSTSLGQLMGSFVFNHIGTTLSAGVKNGAEVNLTGDLAVQAGGAPTSASLDALLGAARASDVIDYEMTSASNGYSTDLKNAVGGESIIGVAGTLSATLGGSSSSLGLSYVHNDIQTSYDAELNGSITSAGGVSVQALSQANIVGVSVGLGATKGKFSGMGSASVNLIGQRTRALLTGGSVTASGLTVNSETRGNQFGLAGNLSIAVGSGSGNAAGAAVSYTLSAGRDYAVNGDTSSTRSAGNEASISNTPVNVGTGNVVVSARHTSDTQSVAASGVAADGNAGFAGTMSFTDVGGVTQAVVDNSDLTAGTVSVTAGEAADGRTAHSLSVAGGLALSKGYAGALAVAWNTMSGVRSAKIIGSDLVVKNTVTVESSAQGAIETLAVAVSAGKDGAGSGSIATNFMISDTSAEFSGGSLSGTATSLTVKSTGSSSIDALAGAVSAGGTGAVGGALAINSVGEGNDNFRVRTRLANTTLSAPVAVTVASSLTGSIDSIAASGSGAGTIAINGSVTTNAIEADVLTEVSGVTQSANGAAFRVNANNDADIASLAGTVSGAGTSAAGAAVSVNKIGGNVKASVADSTLRATDAVEVDASSSGNIKSVAAGVSGAGTTALAGSNTTNAITSTVLAQMSNVTQAATSASLRVQALDSSTIQSFAGTVAGGGTAAGGAAFALNFLGRTSTNADSSKIVKAEVLNSTVNSGGAVQVKALSTSTIESMAMAVGGSGSTAVTGSNTTNLLEDEITASWSGGSLNGTATSLTVQADDAATVRTLAGNFSGGAAGAFGAAIAVNQIGSAVQANLSGMTLGAAPAVVVDADLRGEIKSVSASGAADATVSVNGSFTTNALTASVKAQALNLTQTTNGGAFTVSADNDADIFSLAGTVSGSGNAAVGVAVAVNEMGGDVTAQLKDSTLRATGAVNVQATSSGTVKSVAAGMAGGGTVALAGSNTTNAITSTVLAQMNNVTQSAMSASLRVQALDSSTIQSFAGTVAGGGTAAGGAAFALNFLGRTATNGDSSKVVKAEVLNSAVHSGGAVEVKALSTSTIESMGMAVGAGGSAAVTGSNTTNLLEDEVIASWSGGSLYGTATSLTVQADDAASVRTLAGNFSGSGVGAVGAALADNQIGSTVLANLSGMTLHAAPAVTVDADLRGEIRSVAASGAASAGASINGSFTTNTVNASVKAQALSMTQVTNGGAFTVSADNNADIFSLAGTISGAGAAAVGAAVSVNDIGGDVTARVANSALRATGAVNVQATTSGTLQSVAAGMSGGGTVALAGSNSTNGITSTVLAQVDAVTLVVNAASLSVLARDTSTIQSFAGTVTGGGMAGGGAALALNFLGRTAADAALSKVVKAEVLDSIVRSAGAVQVNAYSTSVIKSIGVAAGVSGTTAINGSNATNLLEDEVAATWAGSDLASSNTLTVSARQAAEIDSLAGNVSGSMGAAVGAALAVNRIGTQTNAKLVGVTTSNFESGIGHWTQTADDLLLSAESDNQINTIAVGMSAGSAGVQGSVAVSVIDSQTHATLGADSHVTNVIASDSVAVTANSRDRIRALAGAVGLGAAGVGAAGGVLTNIISSATTAGITGLDTHVNALANGSGLTVREASLDSAPDLMNITAVSDAVLAGASFKTRTVKGLAVQATSIEQIGAVTAVAGGGALGAAGAAINVDKIGGSTRAYIDSAVFINDAADANVAQATDVMAANHAMVASSATALAIGTVGVSGAVGTEIIERSTRAEVIDGARVYAQGAAAVKAVSTNTMAQISAGAAGGALYGIAGSGDVVLLKGSTVAQVDNATVKADSVSVVADGTNASNLVAGAASYAGGILGAGVGLSFTVNVSGSTVRALVNNATIRADGAVVVDADNRTESRSVSSSASSGGSYGTAVGASVSVMEGATEATVTGTTTLGKRTLATGLLASADDTPLTINLASNYDLVGNGNQTAVRLSLSDLTGQVSSATAVVTLSDGENTVTAVRQEDGTYLANVSTLNDGLLLAQVQIAEGGVQKVATTTLSKSTGINASETAPVGANLPAAQTRISTLSSFSKVDARNQDAVTFVLKSDAGPTADNAAGVVVSDGTRQVTAVLNADGSYTANVSSLGDGVLTARVTVPAAGTETARVTFLKESGAGSLSITADETVVLNHHAGQLGVGGVAGVGASANVVVGKSTVDATLSAASVRVSGVLTVAAERAADIDMITATGGGGGMAGISGAVGVLVFGSAPDSNANSELNGGGGTLSQISGATESDRAQGTGGGLSASESTALNSSGSYDTQGAYAGASGGHRTSATVTAPSIVAGSLAVRSLDRTAVDNNAGAMALGGATGVSAGVAITLLGGANNASVSSASLIVAHDVSIESGMRTPVSGEPAIESRAIAGAGGFVGVGAAVSVASNATASSATLSGSLQAGGVVNVRALDQTSLLSEATGASAGVAAVGVVTATAAQTGSVSTVLAGALTGEGVSAIAERDASTVANARGGVAGVVAGSGAGATASDAGTVSLRLGTATSIDAGSGDLSLQAKSNPSADTTAFGVSVAAGAAVGVSVALSEVVTEVSVTADGEVSLRGADLLVTAVLGSGDGSVSAEAVAGGGGLLLGLQGAGASASNRGLSSVNLGSMTLTASGDVGISANDAMTASASSTGVGEGFVGMGVAVATATSDSTVSNHITALGGSVAGNLTISARGDELINANAVAGSGGVIAGAGAEATVDHQQDVSATASTIAVGMNVAGITTLSADRKVRYDSQTETINASAFGGSGAVTQATLTGSSLASLGDGAKLTGAQLRVLATNDVERTDLLAVSARGGGGGVIAGAGADANTVINGTATAQLGDDVTLTLGGKTAGLLELRAYNQLRGSSVGRLDLGGAIPIALVDTEIRATANANATVGERNNIQVAGEVYVNAMSYVDIEANTITKTYGAAAGAQGDALAHADVSNVVTVGVDTHLVGEGAVTLLAGQDRDFWRNKSYVTARADLFNHAAVPVSVNPDADARLTLNNNVNVYGDAVRSGGTIQVGGIEGSYVVEGKGKVSDWTRDVGELIGISSEYGSSTKTLNANTSLSGVFEAGYGNKQVIVIKPDGSLDASKTLGDIRYSIGTEDLAATGAAYLDTLYTQLKNYGDVAEVRAFVEAEIAFYLESLVREGFATLETDPTTGQTQIVAQENVPGTFLTVQSVRAGSGNVELFGNNITGNANIIARADSEILIDNQSPMNIRVKDLIIDSSGGFAKYNGVYLTKSDGSDIASYNRNTKTGLAMTVDSIDTRSGAAGEELPTLQVINRYISTGVVSGSAVIATAPDGSSADLRQDQMRAPEIRVNGLIYNKLGPISLSNLTGSISVTQEDPMYVPRLDGLEVQVSAGKNIVLSSPSVSQSIGGSPENLYAVAYNDDQQRKLDEMGVVACGTARAGDQGATSFSANCVRNGSGGIYASGGIFLGARYLNVNGTIQSGQPDYKVTLTTANVDSTISAWENDWSANRGSYLAQGRSSLVQVAGRLPTDNEAEINKQFANGSITLVQRDALIQTMDDRRKQPVVYYDAESNRLKVAATEVTGGLVEVVGSIINTGGGVIRALDGYARFDIDNQTSYGMDLLGLDTGGDAGVVRITDLSRPVYTGDLITSYAVTTYQRDAASGLFKATTTAGRGGATIGGNSNSTLLAANALRPELLATFSYTPVKDSTYVWSAGYEFGQEKRYWYQKSSSLWGAINLGSINWNSVDTITKTATAMPEGIYVTTDGAPAQNFTMGTQTFTTAAEKQIYYRSWKKCGTLCFKKTYYVDYRTEVGQKDVFTQRVRADMPIAIELVGYSSGLIDITSIGDIGIAGGITNTSGLVAIDSAQGSIKQFSGGTAVTGNDLRFYAAKGIGEEGAPINVITGTGSFTAQSDSGNVAFQSLGGALRIDEVSTTGKVWLLGDEDIVGRNANAVHVRGSRIEISAPRGGIGEFNADGTVNSTLNIQTEDSAGGGITAHAARGIALKQGTGNLWVNQVASSGGDVYIETAGDLIDNNRNETRDVRTEEELLALWNSAALQGDSAEVSRQRTLTNTRTQFRRYWSLRNAQTTSVNPSTGEVITFTATAYDPNSYQFSFSADEKTRLGQSGLTDSQITALEDGRELELRELHQLYGATKYQINEALIINEVNTALAASGSAAVDAQATWSDAELKSPLPKAIFAKSTTDTQTRIEEPNVVGNRVVLLPGGKIGRDDGAVTIDLFKDGGLTTDDQLSIMSAESDDMSLDRTNWLLTVVKKDTFNVLSNRLNVNSSGFVYLGADTTDAYPNGGDANLEQVIGNGEVRIKVSGSILNASTSGASVIQGHKTILEAASGSIGSASKPVTLSLTGGGTPSAATLVARAQDGIWINQTGDMRVADVYSPGVVSLTAQGNIIDARGERTRAVEAGEVSLIATAGAVGEAANPFVAKMNTAGGVNASSSAGYSVYLKGAETGLTVKNITSGRDIYLDAPLKDVIANGDLIATGRVEVLADDGISLQGVRSGSDIALKAFGGSVNVQGTLTAAGPVEIAATGGISTRAITSGLDISLGADSGNVTVVGDLNAVGRIDVTAGGTGSIEMGSGSLFKAASGDIYLSANNIGLAQLDAARAVVVSASGAITDNNTNAAHVNAAGRSVTMSALGSIGSSTQSVDVLTKEVTRLVATSRDGDAYLSANTGIMRVSQVYAKGLAALSSGYSIFDERGTNQQAVEAANVSFVAGGDIGQATLPMTIKTAVNGVVTQAKAAGSVYLSSPLGLLTVKDAVATSGQLSLNGTAYGLTLTGDMTAGKGMYLNGGLNNVNLTAGANLGNLTGSLVMTGAGITMADGAKVDGSTGTLVLTATKDITLTGLSSDNTTRSAILVSSTAGAVRDAGDTNAYDMKVTSATGGIQVTALGDVEHIETDAPVLVVTSKTGAVSLAQNKATTDVVVTAAKNIELLSQAAIVGSKLSALRGSLVVRSANGGVKLTSATATTNMDISAAGKIELGSIKVPGTLLLNNTGTGGVTTLALSAGGGVTLNAVGNASVGAVSSTAGIVDLESSGGTLTTTTVSGAAGVALKSSGKLLTGALTSLNAGISATSVNDAMAITSAKAKTALLATSKTGMTLSSYAVSAGTADLTSGLTFTSTSGAAARGVTLNAAGNASVGAVSSTAGIVDLESSGGTLTTTTVSGAAGVALKSSGKLLTGALTSLNAGINAESLTGSVAITSAKAKTALLAKSGTSLKLGTFSVSTGNATLTAGTDFTSGTGTTYGSVAIGMGGIGSLGALTATTGSISAASTTKGMAFTTLKAYNGINLRAAANMGQGTYAGFALTGTSLDAGIGAVDAQAKTGNIKFGRLAAKQLSTVWALNGNLTISAISVLAANLLDAGADGTTVLPTPYAKSKTVPTGY